MTIQALRQKVHDKIYGDIVERWRCGKLDDRRFDRAYRLRAQMFVPPLLFSLFILVAVGDWLERDLPVAEHLARVGQFGLIFGLFWLAVGLVIDRNARFGTRDILLRRVRSTAEREQAVATRAQTFGGTKLPYTKLEVGSYARTTRFWNRVLVRTAAGTGLIALVAVWNPRAQLFLAMVTPVLLWALIARFDRRPYVDVSPEGIWCRAWGKPHLSLDLFKAAYPRQNRMGEQGVVLVPRTAEAVAPKLSWFGRWMLRSGESVPAHAGTLTLWTSKVGLDRDTLLRGIQAELSKGAYREHEPE